MRLYAKNIIFFFKNDLINAVKLWNDSECLIRGAAIAFYTATVLVPISAVMIQIMPFWIGRDMAAQQFALGIAGMIGPAATVGISEIAQNSKTESNSLDSAFISLTLTIVGATTVLTQKRGAFTSIWSRSRSDVVGISGHTALTDSRVLTPKIKLFGTLFSAEPYRLQVWSH